MREVDSIIESHRKNFMSQSYMVPITGRSEPVPVLMHTGTGRILGVAKFYLSVEGLLNYDISDRNTLGTPNNLCEIAVENFKTWTVRYNKSKDYWNVDLSFKDSDEVNYFILMNQKLKMMDIINEIIFNQSARLVYKLPYEHAVAAGRLDEINKILTNNIQSDDLNQYPFVSSYAKFRQIEFREAVNELHFKIQNDSTYLSEVEFVRMKYTKLVREQKDLSNFDSICNELMNELYGYSRFGVL